MNVFLSGEILKRNIIIWKHFELCNINKKKKMPRELKDSTKNESKNAFKMKKV